MPDRSYFEADDFADREPVIEQWARHYVATYPQFDIVTARQIVDSHPAMQAILGREVGATPPFSDTLVADEAAPPLKVGKYEWQGEELELDPAVGYQLLAEYRANAAALHAAKEAAKATELKIMETLGGYEHGSVNGQRLFHWPVVDSTTFDKKSFCEDKDREALYKSFLKTTKTRRFKVDGTVGVD